jgi:hypothetical protein
VAQIMSTYPPLPRFVHLCPEAADFLRIPLPRDVTVPLLNK